jgi:hypothetical protein
MSSVGSPSEQRKRAARLALATISVLPVSNLDTAKKRIPRPQFVDSKSCTLSEAKASQTRILAVASPQGKSLVPRGWLDTEGDWSRELRAWSPERRQEQARRRAEAEALIQAKEEQEEKEREKQQCEQEVAIEKHSTAKTSISCAEKDSASVQAELVSVVSPGTPGISQLLLNDSPPQKFLIGSELSCEMRCSDPVSEEVDIEDMCLSDIEELLGEQTEGSSTPKRFANEPSTCRSQPTGEVADLLEELAASASCFDAGDYWIGCSWDIEGLREDAEQLRQERYAYEENIWRTDINMGDITPSDAKDLALMASPQRSPSPELDYPIFTRQQPLKLTFVECDSPDMHRRIAYRRTFARRCLGPGSDAHLGRKLRKILGASSLD